MVAIKRLTVVTVDEDLAKGIDQFNTFLSKLQLEDKAEIIDVKRNGNVYDVIYQIRREGENALQNTTGPTVQG